MNKLVVFLLFGVVALCSARYLPEKKFVKNSPEQWNEVAKKIGLTNKESDAAIDLMKFIQNNDIDSAEMDTNTEWKESMIAKCTEFARFGEIDALDSKVGNVKWSDVKNKTLAEKLDYWNSQYMTMTCEHAKMKTLRNMCILIRDDERMKKILADAKLAGLQNDQIKPSVNLLEIMLDGGRSEIPTLADNCAMLNNDGKFLEIDAKNRDAIKYSDVADQNITMRLRFWRAYANIDDCGALCLFIAMKNVCVEFMSPVERKQIEDMAKEAGIQGDDIPNVVDIQMRIYLADDSRGTINEILLKNYEKLGKNQYTLKVPATEHELKKLESENLTELDLINSAYFWGYKYLETTRVDHLKSLKNLCVVMMKMKPYLTASSDIFIK